MDDKLEEISHKKIFYKLANKDEDFTEKSIEYDILEIKLAEYTKNCESELKDREF